LKTFLDNDNELNKLLRGKKWLYNQSLRHCGSFRPDFRIDCTGYSIVIECDEYQHSKGNYTSKHEMARMKAIVDNLGWPCVFIRFNPDTYREHGKAVRVKMAVRYDKLRETVKRHLKRNWAALVSQPERLKHVIIHKLYYDVAQSSNSGSELPKHIII
jgi:hypothetical protein